MLRNAELTTNKTLQIMNEKTRLIWGELNKIMRQVNVIMNEESRQ